MLAVARLVAGSHMAERSQLERQTKRDNKSMVLSNKCRRMNATCVLRSNRNPKELGCQPTSQSIHAGAPWLWTKLFPHNRGNLYILVGNKTVEIAHEAEVFSKDLLEMDESDFIPVKKSRIVNWSKIRVSFRY